MADQQPQQPQQPEQNNNDNDTSSQSSDHDHECNDNCTYPQCPSPPSKPKCEPVFVPINVEICPILNIKVNKPKICIQNKAEGKPHFFLD